MKIECQHCGYEWEYGGSSEYYATCPRCLYKVPVPEDGAEEENPEDEP